MRLTSTEKTLLMVVFAVDTTLAVYGYESKNHLFIFCAWVVASCEVIYLMGRER